MLLVERRTWLLKLQRIKSGFMLRKAFLFPRWRVNAQSGGEENASREVGQRADSADTSDWNEAFLLMHIGASEKLCQWNETQCVLHAASSRWFLQIDSEKLVETIWISIFWLSSYWIISAECCAVCTGWMERRSSREGGAATCSCILPSRTGEEMPFAR